MSNMPTSEPAMEKSIADDLPTYSACVPYPPPNNSNCPKTHSSLPVNPSEANPLNGIPNPGFQTEIRPHDTIPSAPLLDVRSTLQNDPNVYQQLHYNPTVTPYNVSPPASNHLTQTNPPIHIHRKNVITLQRNPNSAGKSGNSFMMWAAGGFCIVMVLIVITTVTLRHTNRNKNDKYNEIVTNSENDYSATGKINRNYDDRREDDGVVHYDSLEDVVRKSLNSFRKENNMATLSPNINYNEMIDDTFEKIPVPFLNKNNITTPI